MKQVNLTITFDEKNSQTEANNQIPQENQQQQQQTPNGGSGNYNNGNGNYYYQWPFGSFGSFFGW